MNVHSPALRLYQTGGVNMFHLFHNLSQMKYKTFALYCIRISGNTRGILV